MVFLKLSLGDPDVTQSSSATAIPMSYFRVEDTFAQDMSIGAVFLESCETTQEFYQFSRSRLGHYDFRRQRFGLRRSHSCFRNRFYCEMGGNVNRVFKSISRDIQAALENSVQYSGFIIRECSMLQLI